MQEPHYKFFQHKECEFFPCHSANQNCMFCYCPFYSNDTLCNKVGKPMALPLKEGVHIKDCSNCEFPHRAENYELIVCAMREMIYGDYADEYGGGLPKLESLDEHIFNLNKLKMEQAKLKTDMCHNGLSLTDFKIKYQKKQEEIIKEAAIVNYLFDLEDKQDPSSRIKHRRSINGTVN